MIHQKLKPALFVLLFALCFFATYSCLGKDEGTTGAVGEQALVSVGDQTLYLSELEALVPTGLEAKDSAGAAEAYIKLWVNDELMYDVAKKKVADKKRIDELVENYRQSLTVFSYQEQLLQERFSKQLSDKVLKEYYEANKERFKLESNIIKGLFLKVPKKSAQLDNFKEWYRSSSKASLEGIEKNALTHAVIYDYFYDKWINFDEIMSKIPYTIKNSEEFLKSKDHLQVDDSSHVYLLNIKERAIIGSQAPFDYAKPQIMEMMLNQKRAGFLKQFEVELYQKATKDGKIKYHYKKESK